jgi:hypothetical protein
MARQSTGFIILCQADSCGLLNASMVDQKSGKLTSHLRMKGQPVRKLCSLTFFLSLQDNPNGVVKTRSDYGNRIIVLVLRKFHARVHDNHQFSSVL